MGKWETKRNTATLKNILKEILNTEPVVLVDPQKKTEEK